MSEAVTQIIKLYSKYLNLIAELEYFYKYISHILIFIDQTLLFNIPYVHSSSLSPPSLFPLSPLTPNSLFPIPPYSL
jgi:hypothetical protein